MVQQNFLDTDFLLQYQEAEVFLSTFSSLDLVEKRNTITQNNKPNSKHTTEATTFSMTLCNCEFL